MFHFLKWQCNKISHRNDIGLLQTTIWNKYLILLGRKHQVSNTEQVKQLLPNIKIYATCPATAKTKICTPQYTNSQSSIFILVLQRRKQFIIFSRLAEWAKRTLGLSNGLPMTLQYALFTQLGLRLRALIASHQLFQLSIRSRTFVNFLSLSLFLPLSTFFCFLKALDTFDYYSI